MSARLVFATSNAHKVSELEAILAPAWEGFEDGCVARMSDFDVASPIEDGVTFEENSLIKARALARATGLAAIADDSGIAVDVLGGRPASSPHAGPAPTGMTRRICACSSTSSPMFPTATAERRSCRPLSSSPRMVASSSSEARCAAP